MKKLFISQPMRGKYGEEMAMQELMSMMTEAAKLVHYNKE